MRDIVVKCTSMQYRVYGVYKGVCVCVCVCVCVHVCVCVCV